MEEDTGRNSLSQILNPERPSQKGKTAFPELIVDNNTENGFHIELRGKLKHDEATKILSRLLVGREFDFAGGKKIRIKDVNVDGAGVETVIRVDVRGNFDGRLYFTGSPDYNVATDQITINNLDFDLQTKSLLTNTANWLLHGEFRDKI